MLFVHQAPRMWQDPKSATATLRGASDRPRSKRSGSAGSGRRPSSAVGGEAPRRGDGRDRPSRPGSASSGSARFGSALRTSSPPGSARSQTPVLVTSDGGGMHFRVSGRTSPNRPRTPSGQRRSAQPAPSTGKEGGASSAARLDGQTDGGSTPSGAAQKGNGHLIADVTQSIASYHITNQITSLCHIKSYHKSNHLKDHKPRSLERVQRLRANRSEDHAFIMFPTLR